MNAPTGLRQIMLESAPPSVRSRAAEALGTGDEILIQASTDMGPDGQFQQHWLTVTRSLVFLQRDSRAPKGAAQAQAAGPQLPEEPVPIATITGARTEPLVGGGMLLLARRDAPTVRIFYSESLAARFSEIARGIEQLRKGEAFQINAEVERLRCATCARLLPERDGVCPACVKKTEALRRIARYLWPYRIRATILAVASIVMTLAELAPPLITLKLVDDVLVPTGAAPPMDERLALLGTLVLGLIGIRLISWGAEWVHGWNTSWLGAQVTADIRSELFHRLEVLSLQFYDKRKVGTLISRATRDVGMLQDYLVDGLPYLITNTLMIVGILCALLWMSPSLSAFVLFTVPLIFLWGLVFWRRLRNLFNLWSQSWAKLTERTVETLTGIRVVKAFAQEQAEIARFAEPNARVRDIAVRTGVNEAVFFSVITFITGIGMLIVWLFGGQQVLEQTMTLGALLAFYSYMHLFYGPLQWFAQVNDQMTRAFAGAERVFEVIDTRPESFEDPSAQPLPQMRGHIHFRNVTFGYDKSKPVLTDLNLELHPGEMVGLVGRSGVGKTTIVNLIMRFYDVDHGSIEIDGVDIRNLNLTDLRRQIGIVLQEPMLFSGTVADNIGYGKPGATLPEIMQAARTANAHNFIVAHEDGYDTEVGEKGSGLSGGECQRVSIARAILRAPRVLIFDEATASVDVETEKQMQQAFTDLNAGRTTIAIAHRLSTLRDASRIVVIDNGAVAEQGTHQELMDERGIFYDLVQVQNAVSKIIAITD